LSRTDTQHFDPDDDVGDGQARARVERPENRREMENIVIFCPEDAISIVEVPGDA
jgi:ferredoxin